MYNLGIVGNKCINQSKRPLPGEVNLFFKRGWWELGDRVWIFMLFDKKFDL